MKIRLTLLISFLFFIASLTAISFAQRTRDTDQPIRGDFKITFKQSFGGQEMQSTTMIKGQRERSETSMNVPGMPAGMNMSQVNITQCDMKRTIQINDRARKYLITPMDTDSGDATSSMPSGQAGGPARRGGVVTVTVNTVDTGERREMFGFTARHLKQSMMIEASPDACYQQHMKMDRDGWYINLEYGFNCGTDRPPQVGRMPAPQGCRDRYQFKRTGPTNLGYPLSETTTIYGPDGSVQNTMTKEVVELSRQPLDAALFDVPAGYTQAQTQQEMYAAPSMAEMMAAARQQESQNTAQSNPGTPSNTSTAMVRAKVGVVEFNNKAKASVSTDSLRQQLIATLNGDGIDAIALNASSPSEAAIEAKAKGCTYILYTDISTFKAPSTGKKFGGMLGRATGIGGGGDAGKAEAKLDYRLVPVGSTSPKLQSSASGKEDTSDASVNAALQDEARAVAGAVGN
ncbi:MAG TPA: hypothetical protein VNG71_01870 [Pyrinomonadaceae bacterium]|nr:hypothetical protein [Pyrinomonadaceae bacterium]